MVSESTIDDFETFYQDFMSLNDYQILSRSIKSMGDVISRCEPYW
jgi:hypothetical protein